MYKRQVWDQLQSLLESDDLAEDANNDPTSADILKTNIIEDPRDALLRDDILDFSPRGSNLRAAWATTFGTRFAWTDFGTDLLKQCAQAHQ